MATVTVTASCSSSWLALTLPSKMTALSLSSSLSFCRSISPNVCSSFQSLTLSTSHSQRSRSVVCEAAPKGKADSAAKRARQAEKRRLYNKSRKSQIRTRMKKVCPSLFTNPPLSLQYSGTYILASLFKSYSLLLTTTLLEWQAVAVYTHAYLPFNTHFSIHNIMNSYTNSVPLLNMRTS